jgi:hypothetical protein
MRAVVNYGCGPLKGMSLASFFLVMFEHEKPAVREAGWRASTRPKPDLYPVYRPYRSLPVAAEIEVMHIMTTG